MTRTLLPSAARVAPHPASTARAVATATAAAPRVTATEPCTLDAVSGRCAAPLLVAYTNAYLSPGMLRVAELLARRDRVNAHVAAVLPQVHDHAALLTTEDLEALRAGRALLRRRHVRQQVHRIVGRSARFSTSVHEGSLERSFAMLADRRGVGCILTGLDDVGAPGRLESERALLQLARLSAVPVLGIPRGAESVPSTAVVVVDGTDAGARAALAVASVLTRGSRVVLADVSATRARVPGEQDGVRVGPDGRGSAPIASLAGALRSAALRVETVALDGDPAGAVAALAERRRADLVACGTDGPSRAAWYPMAGTAAAVVRRARHAVLLARSPDTPARDEPPRITGLVP